MILFSNIKKSVGLLLVPVILLICYNNAANRHFHNINTGGIIEHAHPYQHQQPGKPAPGHEHTSGEIVFLDHVLLLFMIIILAALIFKPQPLQFLKTIPVPGFPGCISGHSHRYTGRAPPQLSGRSA